MSLKATITGDCRYMSLAISGAQGQASVNISNGEDVEYDFTVQLPEGGLVFGTTLSLEAVGATNGIFKIEVTDSSGVKQYTAALGKCNLNCCIAKKMDSILGCDCGCTKCNHSLIIAERVHLLISGIEADLAQIGSDTAKNAAFYTTAQRKYDKASELCSDDCGCSC
jgi:hypothetical protein